MPHFIKFEEAFERLRPEILVNLKKVWRTAKDIFFVYRENGNLHGAAVQVYKRDWQGDENLGQFNLTELPGCCGVVVSHGALVHEKFRGKGVGDLLHKLRLEAAKEQGYGLALCTTIAGNEEQKKILLKNGWVCFQTFKNPKTRHLIELWSKVLIDKST